MSSFQKFQPLNDYELNELTYEKAVELDKRTYCQYYWSLLKKKHLILFSILPTNDYNVITLKLSQLIVSISLYFTINGFFFNDKAMHKIYKDNGKNNILYLQIFYSSIIPSIINLLIKTLSSSEENILRIKIEKTIIRAKVQAQKSKKCIYIKFLLFFISSLSLMLFFWYFVSCFCAVYNNTQPIFLKDTLISFGISMLYPFGINLIPGIFRIPSLKSEKKNKKCLFKLSQYIAII